MSRRDFMNICFTVGGSLAAGSVLSSCDFGPPETIDWSQDRFFENIESFDYLKAADIEDGLLRFGSENSELFKSLYPTNRFENEKWESSVESSVSVLKRISKVYKALKDKGGLDEKSKFLLERDFYDAGSRTWAILRVGERFRNDPEGLRSAIENSNSKETDGFKDPLMDGDEFTIKSPWVDQFTDWAEKRKWSAITRIVNENEIQLKTISYWWRDKKGPESLEYYKPDPNLPNRPARFSVGVQGQPELGDKILEILERSRLDRVGIGIEVLDYTADKDEAWSAYYLDSAIGEYEDKDHPRDIVIRASADSLEEVLTIYPYLAEEIPIHEAAHALWELIPLIEDDVKVFEWRVKIEYILDYFRPILSIGSFFQPEGKFLSLFQEDFKLTNAVVNETYQYINMATVTQYASWKYGNYDFNMVSGLMYNVEKFLHPVADEATQRTSRFLYGLFNSLDSKFSSHDNYPTFSEYWDAALGEIEQNDKLRKPNVFEQMILDEITNNLPIFEAKERWDYKRETWLYYVKYDVIPVVALHVYLRDPEKFTQNFLSAVNKPNSNDALKQAIENTFLPLVNKRAYQQCTWSRDDLVTDAEQFAEIVAYNAIRKMEGAKNEIDPKAWQYIDNTLNGLIDDLVSDALAYAPNDRNKI